MSAATLSGPEMERSMTPLNKASHLLGWVSLALGAAELLAPRKVARAVGMDESHSGLLRAYGAREVVAGIGAHSVNPVPALWSRVAGDVVDLATLAATTRRDEGGRSRGAWIAIGTVAAITAVDLFVAASLAAERKEGKGETRDYSDRTGFPGGAAAARGAGIVRDAFGGKAGGAAAGDSSPAGESDGGRTLTDLSGAPRDSQRTAGDIETSDKQTKGDDQPQGGGFIGGGQGMSADAKAAIPQPVGYTPA